VSCSNDAGTEAGTAGEAGAATQATGGATFTSFTLAFATGSVDTMDFQVNANCSLTETTLEAYVSNISMPRVRTFSNF